tara:strand:- start:1159 stop:2160 length:1002 start_codon:yes stop_codon:yes gene_type:complete
MKAKIFGLFFLFLIFVFFIQAVVFSLSFFTLINNKILEIPGLKAIQKDIYFKGHRILWQQKKECVNFDVDLIYVPSFNNCVFENVEFKTTLNFDRYGRKNENNFKERINEKIAILGDSETMGWGVNNNETFSSLIEKNLKIKTYNLGVSSYGTYREILRLKKLNNIRDIKTIIIQYSWNDKGENDKFDNFDRGESEKAYEYLMDVGKKRTDTDLSKNIKFVLRRFKSSFRVFYKDLLNTLLSRNENIQDFLPHYNSLINVINKFDFLKNKKIIIFALGDRVTFNNFNEGFDKNNKNIYFLNLSLNEKHFFKLDGHLNKSGHKEVAYQLLNHLK